MEASGRLRALMGLAFFPRGGSAYVTRALARSLPSAGVDVRILAASLGAPGERSHAPTFFADLETTAVEIAGTREPALPYLGSYEDTGAPGERSFARIDEAGYSRLVDTWTSALSVAGAAAADVLHLNHLTPLHEAARRLCPDVPVVAQLHGTELRLLELIREGPPPAWSAARSWEERMGAWAAGSATLIAPSRALVERASGLLGLSGSRFTVVPNGVDVSAFRRRSLTAEARLAHWRRWLVEEPRGSRPGEPAGSLGYSEEDLDAFREDAPVLLFVGRFTEAKRLPLLLRALARARSRIAQRAPLVLVGGYPGELEGSHPLDLTEELGLRDVFLAGWHDPAEVAAHMNAADLFVLPSAEEAFGLVLVEAMACGLPAIASNRGGPAEIVADGETGWLFRADDEDSLACALADAIAHPGERRRRGEQAHEEVRRRFTWEAVAGQVAAVYRNVAGLGLPATASG